VYLKGGVCRGYHLWDDNEFGFDYLRDNIEYAEKDLRQREHNFAIVDEVDSILIDEARTPLIIFRAHHGVR